MYFPLISYSLAFDVKPYKNLCIFLLFHPKNNSTLGTEILSRINYLDKMTRDVTFIMPGYKRAQSNDEVVNESDKNLQLNFNEDLFIKMVQELENKSNGKFMYSDTCELVFIGVKADGSFDFDNYERLDFNFLSKIRGVDPIKLILTVAQQFRIDKNDTIEIKKFINSTLDELTMQDSNPAVKVFIAGAKKLKLERLLLREQLSKLSNQYNLDIRTVTFEDFQTSLTGKEKGRQEDYNRFIKEKADIVIFVFSSIAGRITEEEFDVAYNAFQANNKPEIFVYVKKQFFIFDKRLRNIKERFFSENQEYYVEYKNADNLCYLFYSNMSAFIHNKIKK